MSTRAQRPWSRVLLVGYLVVAVAALIVLRIYVDALDFVSISWMLVLVALPLLPWLLPSIAELLRVISPYVQTFRFASVQLDLRTVKRDPISLPSKDILAFVPNDYGALSSSTAIGQMISSLRNLRRAGGGPVGIIDIRDGHKWRLPNLYFLSRLLEKEPVVSEFVFTDLRNGTDGFVLGTCSPAELCHQIDRAVPRFADASSALQIPTGLDSTDDQRAQDMADAFQRLITTLGPPAPADDDPVHGWVNADRLVAILHDLLDATAVETASGTLTEADVRAVLASAHPFVPVVAGGRLAGLVDRAAVALAVARVALAHV